MHGVTIDCIIPLFEIASLDHERYPGVKCCYLAGDTALVNCDLLQLIGILPSEEKKRAQEIPAIPPSTTSVNCVPNTKITLKMNAPHHRHTNPQRNHPTSNTQPRGGTLEMHRCDDARRQVLSGVTLQSPRQFPETKFPPRSWMPGVGQSRIHMPEGRHNIG